MLKSFIKFELSTCVDAKRACCALQKVNISLYYSLLSM